MFYLEVLFCKRLQMWRYNDVIGRSEYLISTWSESTVPYVYSLQFLFKSTHHSWRYGRKCEWVFFFWTQCIYNISRFATGLTLWRPLLPYGYSNKSCYATRGQVVICNFWHPGTLTLMAERQSARMSKITSDGLTRSGTGCFIAVVPM